MDRDQLIKEIIFDKLMKMTENKNSVIQLRVSRGLQGVKIPKNYKIVFFWACCIEFIVGDKDLGFYAFLYTKLIVFQEFRT